MLLTKDDTRTWPDTITLGTHPAQERAEPAQARPIRVEDEQVKQVIDIAICGKCSGPDLQRQGMQVLQLCNPNTPLAAEEQSQTQQQANINAQTNQ